MAAQRPLPEAASALRWPLRPNLVTTSCPGASLEQRAVPLVRDPDIAAGLSQRRGLAAEGYGRRDGIAPRIHPGHGRVQRIEHPQPGRAAATPWARHRRESCSSPCRSGVDPASEPEPSVATQTAPSRGQAAGSARADYALVRPVRVDPSTVRRPAGDPQRARAEQDIARLAGQRDGLRHRVSPRVDPGQGAVVPVEHPDLTAGGHDTPAWCRPGWWRRPRAAPGRLGPLGRRPARDPHRARSRRHVGRRCSQRHSRLHRAVAGEISAEGSRSATWRRSVT